MPKYFSFTEKDKCFTEIIKFIQKNKINSILDVGASNGHLIGLIKKNTSVKIIKGIDIEPAFLNRDIQKGSITKIQFKDNSFDLIIAKDVIEHVQDNIKAINELKRVSKKYIFISAPAPFTDCAWGDYQHKRPYSKSTFRHIAHDFNLDIIKLSSIKRKWPFQIIAKLWMQDIDDITVYCFYKKRYEK